MSLNQNQFRQKPIQGELDLSLNNNTVAAQVDSTQVTALVPGQAVKLVPNATGGVPKVVSCAAVTDDVFGFVNYSQKNSTFAALAALEISLAGNVMYMTAGAAITQRAFVNIVVATPGSVVTDAGGGATKVGWAYDGAAALGDVIRVYVKTPV